jgi:hypothetical protein
MTNDTYSVNHSIHENINNIHVNHIIHENIINIRVIVLYAFTKTTPPCTTHVVASYYVNGSNWNIYLPGEKNLGNTYLSA